MPIIDLSDTVNSLELIWLAVAIILTVCGLYLFVESLPSMLVIKHIKNGRRNIAATDFAIALIIILAGVPQLFVSGFLMRFPEPPTAIGVRVVSLAAMCVIWLHVSLAMIGVILSIFRWQRKRDDRIYRMIRNNVHPTPTVYPTNEPLDAVPEQTLHVTPESKQ